MEQVLLVVQVIIAVGLIGMVLIQRSDSDGFGLGGGGAGGGLLSGRAQANLMTRTTAILAALFIINSLALSVMAANTKSASIVDTIEEQQQSDKAAAPAVPVDADKKTDKKAEKKPVVKDEAPAVPSADADEKAAADAEPAPVKKPAKKVAAPKVTDEEAAEANE